MTNFVTSWVDYVMSEGCALASHIGDGELKMEAPLERNVEPVAPREDWWMLLMLGIATLILGVVAIILPLATAVTINGLVGILLLLGGIFQVVHAFRRRETAGRVVLGLVVAALYVIAGLILLAHPFAAVLTFTLFLAAFFIVAGVFKVIGAFEMHGVTGWGWNLVGGILTFILGVLIWAHWPSSAVWAIGLLVGIDLLFTGWTMIALALTLHMLSPSTTGRLAGQH